MPTCWGSLHTETLIKDILDTQNEDYADAKAMEKKNVIEEGFETIATKDHIGSDGNNERSLAMSNDVR